MPYKLKSTRAADGEGYTLAYGKGKKKLAGEVRKNDAGEWAVVEGFGTGLVAPSKRLKDIKDAWEPLAVAQYDQSVDLNPVKNGTPELNRRLPVPPSVPGPPKPGPPTITPVRTSGGPPAIPKIGGPPSIPARSGPPSIKPPAPTPAPEEPPFDATSKRTVETCSECGAPKNGWHNGVPPCRCEFNNTDAYVPDPLDPKMFDEDQNLTPVGALDMVFAWMLRNKEYVSTNGILDPVWSEVQAAVYRATNYPHHSATRFLSQ